MTPQVSYMMRCCYSLIPFTLLFLLQWEYETGQSVGVWKKSGALFAPQWAASGVGILPQVQISLSAILLVILSSLSGL